MMAREWQPGEVCSFLIDDVRLLAIRNNEGQWSAYGGSGRSWERRLWDGLHDQRPLAVIDAEDTEAVERLWRLEAAQYDSRRNPQPEEIANLQAALREFADPNPPCGASLALGKNGALYRCAEAAGHVGPHADGICVWTAEAAS